MPELNNAKFAFDNAIKLLNDNNLKSQSVEQLNEIIKIEPNHMKITQSFRRYLYQA